MRKELIIVLFLQCEHKSEVYLDTKVVETYIHYWDYVSRRYKNHKSFEQSERFQ